jgi:hypothetical protein
MKRVVTHPLNARLRRLFHFRSAAPGGSVRPAGSARHAKRIDVFDEFRKILADCEEAPEISPVARQGEKRL